MCIYMHLYVYMSFVRSYLFYEYAELQNVSIHEYDFANDKIEIANRYIVRCMIRYLFFVIRWTIILMKVV